MNGNIYFYSGAETKLSYISMRPHPGVSLIVIVVHYACNQLEERARLLDGMMNLGYGKRTMFNLRIFVPILASSIKETKLTKSIKPPRPKQFCVEKL